MLESSTYQSIDIFPLIATAHICFIKYLVIYFHTVNIPPAWNSYSEFIFFVIRRSNTMP